MAARLRACQRVRATTRRRPPYRFPPLAVASLNPMTGDGQPPRAILVVDDEPVIRSIAARALQDDRYQVIEAADGAEAMEAIETAARIDLVISDVLMPGLDGASLAHAIRRRHPDLPILLVSGYGPPLILPPNTYFLAKPFTLARLSALAREILESPG